MTLKHKEWKAIQHTSTHCIPIFCCCYSQKSSNATDANEIESLRKECEAAKKKAKNTLEKYFSESDRLKAIIDEMQGMWCKLQWVLETGERLTLKTHLPNILLCALKNLASNLLQKHTMDIYGSDCNKPFSSCFLPLFQNETWCTALHMDMSLICKTMNAQEKYISIRNVMNQNSFWNMR